MKSITLKFILLFAAISSILGMCSKEDVNNNEPDNGIQVNASAADKIAGVFKGTGKYLPGGISLGNTLICTPPSTDYQTLFQIQDATINITKLTDSTVKMGLTTGPFPQDSYTEIKLKENGDMIEFFMGYFDMRTKTILFSGVAPNFSYSYSKNCKDGLPYYYSTLLPGSSGNPEYYNFTIKRYEFNGTRQ